MTSNLFDLWVWNGHMWILTETYKTSKEAHIAGKGNAGNFWTVAKRDSQKDDAIRQNRSDIDAPYR